jgi:hypothetical protein
VWKFAIKIWKEIRETLDFLDSVITGDESKVFQYDPQTKRPSMQWQTLLLAVAVYGRVCFVLPTVLHHQCDSCVCWEFTNFSG